MQHQDDHTGSPEGSTQGSQLQTDLLPPVCLTFLIVVEDLHLALLRAQQGLRQLGQGALHGAGPHQELAGTRLLHDLRPGEAEHLAEAFVAEDDATVLHLGVGDQELAVWRV